MHTACHSSAPTRFAAHISPWLIQLRAVGRVKTRGRVVQDIEFLRPKPKCPQTVAIICTFNDTKLSIHLLSVCVCCGVCVCVVCVICVCHTYERHARHPAVAVASATHHSATHALAWMGTGGRADLDGHAGTSKVKNECLNQLSQS